MATADDPIIGKSARVPPHRRDQARDRADRRLTSARIVPLVNSSRLNGNVKDVLAAFHPWRTFPEVRAVRPRLRAST
jgi:hypothetical protein